MAILSDASIRKEIEAGNIVLYDPDNDALRNIQNCSVDFTLGPNYFRINRKNNRIWINPWSKVHSCEYWGNTVNENGDITYNSFYAETITTERESNVIDLPLNKQYIVLRAGETILGHTNEFIGGKNGITTMMKARSSLGRSNITVCRDAGFGDIGYINRWTLEITNNGPISIILPVGLRIGQIAFFYTTETETKYDSKYQHTQELDKLVSEWKPSMMCPKLWNDKEVQ